MKRQSIWFANPGQIEVREEEIYDPGPGQVLVQTRLSAISPGTELLFYHGQVPEEMALDESIAALPGRARFPFKYGYASVGLVGAVGRGVKTEWLGKRVFSFHPHESAYLATPVELLQIPDGICWEDAVFLPNMETALNLVMDAAPLMGETAAVFGLGIIGLLTTALLARLPLSLLAALEPLAARRAQAEAGLCVDPFEPDALERVVQAAGLAGSPGGVDLVLECSGSARALDQALAVTGVEGRIVIGSWYGKNAVTLNLGGRFHRSRIRLIGSQVSTLAAGLTGRWSKQRRFGVAWEQIRQVRPSRWITQRFSGVEAAKAYHLLSENPAQTIQVILDY